MQLYDLAHDVSEANDVAARHPGIVSKIESYLTTARTPPRPHDTGSFEYRR